MSVETKQPNTVKQMNTKNTRLKTITVTQYEVATSSSGEPNTWVRNHQPHPDTDAGLEMANATARQLSHSNRFVRVARVERKIIPKKVIENTKVASKQEIADLLAKGKAACAGIAGIMVNEGMLMSMSDMSFSPVRVTASFHAASVLGPVPKRSDCIDGNAYNAARANYSNKSLELMKEALCRCAEKLTAAGIKFVARSQEIELKP